jgi:hypothetical protein
MKAESLQFSSAKEQGIPLPQRLLQHFTANATEAK